MTTIYFPWVEMAITTGTMSLVIEDEFRLIVSSSFAPPLQAPDVERSANTRGPRSWHEDMW